MRPFPDLADHGADFDAILDRAYAAAGQFGMDGLVYDFAPVPFTPDGAIITPSLFGARNMPVDMGNLWCDQGHYQIDPVQKRTLRSSRPLHWSYHAGEAAFVGDDTAGPVADYLRDYHLARGLSVPVHTPEGSATITGFWQGGAEPMAPDNSLLAKFMLLASMLHDSLMGTIDIGSVQTTAIHLTPRERQCLLLCGEGFSDKQAAHELGRSVSTVVMHLQSAMRKLGARNRAQAIARAAHYGLLR